MATRQKLTEEFLICIICHEVFKDPVTLHCGHTLCNQCTTAYTKTQKQTIGDKSIPCPHCQALTKVPDPTKPVDVWAGQFHTGFFIKGLVDAVVTDKKDYDECIPCQGNGEELPAVFWCSYCGHGLCSGCEKVHRNIPMLKGHEVISLSDDNRHSVKKSRKRFTCSKHPDAVIDMMCEDHDVAMCHRCCILYHRTCESVITLEECLPKLKSVIETHGTELEAVVGEATKELSVRKSQVKELEKEAEKAVTVIEASREKIIAEVRKQEKNLKVKVKETKEEVLQHLHACIKSGEMWLEGAQQKKGLIREAIESGIPMNCYEMYKMCTPSTGKYIENTSTNDSKIHIRLEENSGEIVSHIRTKSVAVLSLHGDKPSPAAHASKPTDTPSPTTYVSKPTDTPSPTAYVSKPTDEPSPTAYASKQTDTPSLTACVSKPANTLSPTLSVSKHISTSPSKGCVSDIKEGLLPTGSASKPTLVKKIETGLKNILDMVILTVSGIKTVIVTSGTGQCVASFYRQKGKQCESQLQLNGNTYNITQISPDKCAVTVNSAKQIVFICVTPHLKRCKTLRTSKGYQGLTCLNSSTLAASRPYPGVVDILDMSGTVLRSFGSDVFTFPAYLSCTSDNIILVSDCNKQSLTGITDTGVIKFKYPQQGDKTLQHPLGLCHSGCGEIFVADDSSHSVVQLTDTGKFVREVLSSADDLRYLSGLCVDSDNMMYVSVTGKTIHVYKFK